MTPEQLPAQPHGRPVLPQPCIVCGDAVVPGSGYGYVEPPVLDNEGYLCGTCTGEARALFVAIVDRRRSQAARTPAPAPTTD